jgi:hypothetical protein
MSDALLKASRARGQQPETATSPKIFNGSIDQLIVSPSVLLNQASITEDLGYHNSAETLQRANQALAQAQYEWTQKRKDQS